MKALRIVAVAVLLIAMMLVASIIAVNVKDQELDPAVKTLLENPLKVPAEAIEGYQFMLGLKAPADKDPKAMGLLAYKAKQASTTTIEPKELRSLNTTLTATEASTEVPCAKSDLYCNEADYRASAERIQKLLTNNKVLCERFDKLLSYPGYGSDLAPSLQAGSVPAADILTLSRLSLLGVSALIRTGKQKDAVTELQRLHDFFKSSLAYPSTRLETAIQLSILDLVRNFLITAAKDDAQFAALLTPDIMETFKLNASFAEVTAHVFSTELGTLSAAVDGDGYDLSLLGIGMAENADSPWVSLPGKLGPIRAPRLFFQRNETLNQSYAFLKRMADDPCVTTERECEATSVSFAEGSPFRNPGGRGIMRVMMGWVPNQFKKINHLLSKLSQPIQL